MNSKITLVNLLLLLLLATTARGQDTRVKISDNNRLLSKVDTAVYPDINQEKNKTTLPTVDSVVEYIWDTSAEEWVESQSQVCHFDDQGNKINQAEFTWDKKRNQWVEVENLDKVVAIEGSKTKDAYYRWNDSTQQWQEVSSQDEILAMKEELEK